MIATPVYYFHRSYYTSVSGGEICGEAKPSFWATLKVEYYYRHAFRIHEEVYEGVSTWIEGFYNHKRIHSAIGYQNPVEYELHAAMNIAA
ncbi:IS3 family transposase [Trueperella abortisuis]|uniref:Transposase InsO family protein n=1 Tax=Trueperella abortisuis TaxID=445930 RepID=A0ABT9PIV1_9ACTO|nr:IS3 family transposase [Trueperella abortisuis]MDP9832633.1 transposase InsO family protein [Trueperella abortisuis]